MKSIIETQRNFFNTNQTKDTGFRIEQLKKLGGLLKSNEQLLDDAIFEDFSKSGFENFMGELSLVHAEIATAIKKVRKWARKKRVRTNLINFPASSYVIPEPLGVSLVIGAWNYPYQICLAPVVAAIAAGNTVILKPSELAPATSHAMAGLINSNFDPAFFKVVEGGIAETTALLAQRFDKIFFTGSVKVGKVVYLAAAKNLTPITLELGGKSPAIIIKDCNLEVCVKRLIWSKFLNAGQTCIAPDYILIEKSIKDRFLKLAVEEIEKEKFSIENQNYVQIINDRNIKRLSSLLEKDKIFYGGSFDAETRIFEPTIMHNVEFTDTVMQEEIFGPILPVITFESLDTAIAEIKKGQKPLACYIFTTKKDIRDRILREISFGGGAINDAVMHLSNGYLGFGGVGESGIGSYHGEAGFKAFSHFKSILDKPTWFEPGIKYYPHSKTKLKLIRAIMRLS